MHGFIYFVSDTNSDSIGLVTSSSSDFSHLLAELKRKPSLHVVLPKFGSQTHNGSTDSLNKSPHSPGMFVYIRFVSLLCFC